MIIKVEVDEVTQSNIEDAIVKYFIKNINIVELRSAVAVKVTNIVATDYKINGAVNAGIGLAKEKIALSIERKLKHLLEKDIFIKFKGE